MATERIYLPNREDVQTLGGHIAPILSSAIEACYEALAMKGAEMPEERTLANLPATCESVYDRLDEFLANPLSVDDIHSSAKSIRQCAFYGCTSLTSVNFPAATSVQASAFYGCAGLRNVTLPSVTSTDSRSFGTCTNLFEVSLPNLTSLGSATFYYDSTLTAAHLPEVTTTSNQCFVGCSKLATVNFPEIKSLGGEAFRGCASLTDITLGSETTPNCTSIGNSILYDNMGTKTITVWGAITSNFQWIQSASSGSKLENIYFPVMTGAYTLTRTAMFTNVPTTCIWHVSDGTIEYVEGAWTFIPAES